MRPEIRSSDFLDADDGTVLNVFVAYEDFGSRLRAEHLVECVKLRCGLGNNRLKCVMWPFDALALPSKQALAVNHAQASEIILVVAEDGAELPCAVRDWLHLGVTRGNRRPRCLGAFLQRNQGDDFGPQDITAQLRQVAREANIDFFDARGGGAAPSDGPGNLGTVLARPITNDTTAPRRRGARTRSLDGAEDLPGGRKVRRHPCNQ